MILRKNMIVLLVAMVSVVGSIEAQNTVDSKGRKQGTWVKYHADGKTKKYVGEFLNDKPVGKFVFYYETGEASSVVEHGTDGWSDCKLYHVNGSLMAKGRYYNQLKEGVWWYFGDDKMVLGKETYKEGKLEGIAYKYFPAAVDQPLVVLEEINYVNGMAQGTWKRYYKDGKIQIKGNYKDGLEYGECTWYSTSGKAETVGYFKHGVKNGYWRFYDKDGNETKIFYLNGTELKGEMLEKYEEAVKMEQQKNNK